MVDVTSRARFVGAAQRLFAEKGYAGTSIADIQTALGLTAGSGALYKHFPSKRALLAEVVGTHLATMRAARAEFVDEVPTELRPALEYVADAVWASMERDRDIIRVLLRDLDAHPELLERLWAGITEDVYETFTVWLREQVDRGTVSAMDPQATAAVLLAALTYRPILATLIDRVPGDLTAERYRAAWIEQALATLQPNTRR